ncbi:MAG: M1 family metallopeptidase [Acidobacteria bacterium]|nr:M1 family metallopeptidase [Acidobacteriota bacterium]
MSKHLKMFAAALVAVGTFGPILRGQTYKSQLEHPIVRYKMAARLDTATKTVKGSYTLVWWNHTEEAIPDLYFHLYLNAFKNMDSTFMRERGISRRRELLKEWTTQTEQDKWGWVDVDRIQIAGGPDLTASKSFIHPDDDNAADQTVMRVELPQPIPPLGTIELAVDFTSKLPRALARTGFVDDYFLVAQWFPKIGVYESAAERNRKSERPDAFTQGAWNCHQYHANTEFFADFGVYDVELTVPSRYVVGATGVLRGERRNPDATITYNFYQEDVHDFAWTASPHFLKLTRNFEWGKEVRADELVAWSKVLDLPAQELTLRDVSVTLLLQPDHRNLADRYFRAAFNALKYYGLWYGQYPYDTLTVVDPARNSQTSGMEYPTLITGGTYFWPGERSSDPEGVTVHEFGHQFWYGLVANNEFENAWLDEGLNTYSTGKVLETAYPPDCSYRDFFGIPVRLRPWLHVNVPPFPFAGVHRIPVGAYFSCVEIPQRTGRRGSYLPHAKDDELVRNGWEYLHGPSYSVNSYDRVALTLRTLEGYLGEAVMARAMRTYHQRWRYRHPIPQDFFDVINEVSGRNMDWFFEQFFRSSDLVDYAVTQIVNEPLEGKIGIYDENGKKTSYFEKPATEAFEKSKEKRYRSTIVVRRLGEALAPVDVVVRFENGEIVREQWDGQYRWTKFVYERPSKAKSAEVDPERKLAIEANFTNNSRTSDEDNRAAAKWYVRWIFWLENLFFAASFFS